MTQQEQFSNIWNTKDQSKVNEDGFTALDIATRGYGGEYLTEIYTELFAKY